MDSFLTYRLFDQLAQLYHDQVRSCRFAIFWVIFQDCRFGMFRSS